jgi:hypothetical protein
MAAGLLLDPSGPKVADPVEACLLEDQVGNDKRRGPRRPQQHREVVHVARARLSFWLVPPDRAPAGWPRYPAYPSRSISSTARLGAPIRVGGLEIAHVAVHGERVIEHDRLGTVARPAPDRDAAGVRAEVTREDAEQGGLPVPVLADHSDHLTRSDLKIETGPHPMTAKRLADSPCR